MICVIYIYKLFNSFHFIHPHFLSPIHFIHSSTAHDSHSSFIICSSVFFSSFFIHPLSSIISMSFGHNFHSSNFHLCFFTHPSFIFIFIHLAFIPHSSFFHIFIHNLFHPFFIHLPFIDFFTHILHSSMVLTCSQNNIPATLSETTTIFIHTNYEIMTCHPLFYSVA